MCAIFSDEFAVWRGDDNGNGRININELVYIGCNPARDSLYLYKFSSSTNPVISLSDIGALTTGWWWYNGSISYTRLMPQCSDLQFRPDTAPPRTKFVSISFNLTEDGVVKEYEINTALRAWAGNLLDKTSSFIVGDDD